MQLNRPILPNTLPPPELLTQAQMAEADRAAPISGQALMDRAGWAVAQAARSFGPRRTLVLCGPGNNGGDGYVAASLLARQGWPVRVATLAPPRPNTDAAHAAATWRGPTAPFTAASAAWADLVIDAVFGAGLDRPVPDTVAQVLAAASRVLAVDVPSGLDGATGTPLGQVRQADATVTFFRLKPGHLLLPGHSLCGHLTLADIGIPPTVLPSLAPTLFLNRPGLWHLPALTPTSHKYTRGHVTILGGPAMTGAARLAANACLRGGAGLVTIAAQGNSAPTYRATASPGIMVTDTPLQTLLEDKRREVWVCGPGLGQQAAATALPALIAAHRQIVADADTLALCAGAPDRLRGVSIITPHEGEFTKLFGFPTNRLQAAQAAAKTIDAVVVLKGADTIIAAPTGHAAINASAPPSLATAGAGDVLSGLIGALLAQGMNPFEAACAAVWLHGRAAARLGPGLVAEELPEGFAGAVAEVG